MEKITFGLLLGIIGVGLVYLIEGIIKLSEKISQEYSFYIFIFIIFSVVGIISQLAPDSEENK